VPIIRKNEACLFILDLPLFLNFLVFHQLFERFIVFNLGKIKNEFTEAGANF